MDCYRQGVAKPTACPKSHIALGSFRVLIFPLPSIPLACLPYLLIKSGAVLLINCTVNSAKPLLRRLKGWAVVAQKPGTAVPFHECWPQAHWGYALTLGASAPHLHRHPGLPSTSVQRNREQGWRSPDLSVAHGPEVTPSPPA